MNKLGRHFFYRYNLEVAKELFGKIIFFNGIYGIIRETGAYIGKPLQKIFK
jgi:3-methyladenine DNA glycosylase Mpg